MLRVANAIDLHCHFGPDTVGGSLEADPGYGVSALQELARQPKRGLRDFLESLWADRLAEDDITTMVATKPGRLLGLSD
jgi:hypothetical protein